MPPWSTPTSYTTGMTLTASDFNRNLRDNLIAARNLWDGGLRLSLDANQSVSNNVQQNVSWENVDWEVNPTNTSLFWRSASATKLLCPWIGRYQLSGTLEWNNSSNGHRGAAWSMNGATDYHISAVQPLTVGRGANLPIGAFINVTATSQFITVKAFQNCGSALSLHGGTPDRTHITWRFIGAAT